MMTGGDFQIRALTFRPAPDLQEIRIDLDVTAGSAMVFQGPSGSGKTTLLRALARLRPVDSGEVFLGRTHWRSIPPREWRRRVAFIPSKPRFRNGSVLEALRFPFSLKIYRHESFPDERARKLASRIGLPEEILHRETSVLSDGERVRIGLLRALLVSPEVFLLDEPTSPLDGEGRAAVTDLLRDEMKRGRSILIATHDDRLAGHLGATTHRIGRNDS